MKTCSQSDCIRKVVGRGLCSFHYCSAKNAGTLDDLVPKIFGPCAHCGNAISPTRRYGSQFCSIACKEQSRVDATRDQVMGRRLGRICLQCGGPIPIEVNGRAQTCSRSCGVALQNAKRRTIQLAAWELRKKPCPQCGAEVPTSRWGALYCSEKCKRHAIAARWREKSPGYMRQYLYGVTPEQFDALLASQEGRCAICRTDTPKGQGGWHLDHDHATGTIRGLLCHHCNLMLGNAHDNPERLFAAVAYLQR